MSHYFLDSSALMKRHFREPGSAWIRTLTSPGSGHSIIVAQIVEVEAVSSIARRRREGRFSSHVAQNLRALAERQIARCLIIYLTDAVMQQACDLLERHPLRAYDAVQLASALESNRRFLVGAATTITFVSADRRLLAAAAAEGLAGEDPNLHI